MLFIIGCEKGEDVNTKEIKIGDVNPVIAYTTNGITFKFCLLNENRMPVTVFNVGENIVFSFSITNDKGKIIYFPTDFINTEFYRVFQQNGTDMGKSWTGLWCDYNLQKQEIELKSSGYQSFDCPWILKETFQPNYPLCMSESKLPLFAGDYYAIIKSDFIYFVDNERKEIKNISFKINFKIK
jgi:hypothetical protein